MEAISAAWPYLHEGKFQNTWKGLVSRLPDAAVVLERAGGLLTFQAELNGTWIVFFLQENTETEFTESQVWTRIHQCIHFAPENGSTKQQ